MSYTLPYWITIRPIDQWPGELTRSRHRSTFSASLSATYATLTRELRALEAKRVVLQVAIAEADFRLDGQPRARAIAAHPGIILAFDSKFGPLKYATDVFATWQDNIRAVALGLEALRKVDRYGVSKRGEQYTGWRAIPQQTGGFATREDAQRFLESHGGFRNGARQFHPDNPDTGDESVFKQLVAAKELAGA